MLLTPLVLVPLLLAAEPVPSPPRAAAAQDTIAARKVEPEFEALMKRYEAALRDWGVARIVAVREKRPEPAAPHPARTHLAAFQALAAKGSGGALGWIVENLVHSQPDPALRARMARESFDALVASHPDQDSVFHALEGLRSLVHELDEDAALAMGQRLAEASTVPEIQAQAILLQAWFRTQGESTTDPERLADAVEIRRSLVYGFPNTQAARQASSWFVEEAEREFLAREQRWLEEVRGIQAAGGSPDTWPPQPIHEMPHFFLPLAACEHPTAMSWVNGFYPAFLQAERQGLGFGLAFLSNRLVERYSDGRDGPWTAFRVDLLGLVYRQFPDAPWTFDSLCRLVGSAISLPPARVEEALRPLLEARPDARLRPTATYVEAVAWMGDAQESSFRRAEALLVRMLAESPDDPLAGSAREGLDGLRRILPGAVFPALAMKDVEGIDFDVAAYRGRVVLLDFFTLVFPSYAAEELPRRAALHERMQGRPFSLLGVNTDSLQPPAYRSRPGASQVRWRTGLIHSGHGIVWELQIRRWPSTVVIDHEGVIRALHRPWEETEALVEELVKAVEALGPPR